MKEIERKLLEELISQWYETKDKSKFGLILNKKLRNL